VANAYPFNGAALQILGKQIECVAHDAIAALDPCLLEGFDDDFSNFLSHVDLLNECEEYED
jgi:hypothetical protein